MVESVRPHYHKHATRVSVQNDDAAHIVNVIFSSATSQYTAVVIHVYCAVTEGTNAFVLHH